MSGVMNRAQVRVVPPVYPVCQVRVSRCDLLVVLAAGQHQFKLGDLRSLGMFSSYWDNIVTRAKQARKRTSDLLHTPALLLNTCT